MITATLLNLEKVINLRKINLLADFQHEEASMFEPLSPTCFRKTEAHHTGSGYDYYASTKAFYSKMASTASLEASLQSTFTLGATLSSVIQTASAEESNVSGMSLIVLALTEKGYFGKRLFD